MSATVRGSVVKSAYEYLERTYGAETWDRTLSVLDDADVQMIRSMTAFTKVPVGVDGRILTAFTNVAFAGDRMAAEQAMRQGGASQADTMLNGIFSVFARFTSPRQAFLRTGSIVTSVYDGVQHETTENPGGRGGTLTIRGMGDGAYAAPWQCGWIERAFIHFGSQHSTCKERSWERGRVASDELVYDITF